MEIVETLGLICFGGLVLITYITVMTAIAIVGIQAKQKYSIRLRKALARGAFADLETPKNKFRFRLLAGIAIFGLLGMAFSFVVLFLQMAIDYSNVSWVTIAISLIFGAIGAVAGFLMYREINHRL